MLRRLEQQFSRNRSRSAANATSPTSKPQHRQQQQQQQPRTPRTPGAAPPPAFSTSSEPSTSEPTTRSADYTAGSATSGISSRASLSSLRDSLPENPKIYEFSEISAATNNFLSKRTTSSASSTPSWKCNLRGKDAIVFQRKLHKPTTQSTIRTKLSLICKSHHAAVIKLLGASISGDSIYLVYESVTGSNLAECLRPLNPSYTVLSTWMSRMQVAVDMADGLDYIHNNTGLEIRLVHNHIKSSSIIVTESTQSARICHFGTAELCSEPIERSEMETESIGMRSETTKMVRSGSVKFRGTPGYMAPEFKVTGIGTQKSDVYAFGVVTLELISGKKPVRYDYDAETGEYVTISLIESARTAIDGDESTGGGGGEGHLRRWVDSRLRDSFPVDVAERMTRLALDCVHVDPDQRPDMRRVASKSSGLYLRSMKWAENLKIPTDFTASFAPR